MGFFLVLCVDSQRFVNLHNVLEHYLDMVGVTGSNPVPRTVGKLFVSWVKCLEALILWAGMGVDLLEQGGAAG